MHTLLQKVRAGVRAGTALWIAGAGCSDSMTRPEPTTDAGHDAQTMLLDGGSDAAQVVDASRDANAPDAHVIDDAGHDAGGLQPYPLSALGCNVPDAVPLCCLSATCVNAAGPCEPVEVLTPLGLNGSLACGIAGPFAPNPEDLNDGRPLFVDHDMLVASIVLRRDCGAA